VAALTRVSARDRDKWNARYREGAYQDRQHPSPLVERWASGLPAPGARALDVACGAGRNALWLAAAGFCVDAVDIADAGLAQVRRLASERRLAVACHCLDLDEGLPAALDGYDLIIVIRYLNRALLPSLCERLRPGGLLVCEVHLVTDADVIGPGGDAFRAAPGELAGLLAQLQVLESQETVTQDPDGRPVALARLVGRRPLPA